MKIKYLSIFKITHFTEKKLQAGNSTKSVNFVTFVNFFLVNVLNICCCINDLNMIEFIESNWIEIVGAVMGIVYLYYEYKADIKMWPAGIIMSAFYIFVFVQSKFYAFACINGYYILAAIYGWIKWYRPKDERQTGSDIIHTPSKYIVWLIIANVVIYFIISFVLVKYTDSPVAYGDSLVTTLSIVSMWMLAHKLVEQWLLLIVLNIISVFLYFSQGLYPTSLMYLVYVVVSVLAYFSWKNKIVKNKESE